MNGYIPVNNFNALARLFSRCHTPYSSRLDEDVQRDIIDYLSYPSEPSWEKIYGLSIYGHTTLWQAVRLVDPTFPNRGREWRWIETVNRYEQMSSWSRIPTPELVIKAIAKITRIQEESYENCINKRG